MWTSVAADWQMPKQLNRHFPYAYPSAYEFDRVPALAVKRRYPLYMSIDLRAGSVQ